MKENILGDQILKRNISSQKEVDQTLVFNHSSFHHLIQQVNKQNGGMISDW